jgi:uncharacterized protein (TIGR02284 family)
MKDVLDTLNDLLMLDHDAVRAYTAAIDRISIPFLQEKLTSFRTDHERHISDLTALILKFGGTPKSHQDLKGPFIQGVTAMRSMMGDEQALKAMKGNEQLTNKKYAEALQRDLPPEAEKVIRRNYQDEVRHLAWLNQALLDRLFEQRETEVHP